MIGLFNSCVTQILSVGIRGAENNFTSLSTPVEYRIYTTDRRVTPRGAQCAIFSPSSNDWQRSSCEVTVRLCPPFMGFGFWARVNEG